MLNDGKFMTPHEVGKWFSFSARTIRAWIHAGELKAWTRFPQRGRPRFLVDPVDLLEFVERHLVRPVMPLAKATA